VPPAVASLRQTQGWESLWADLDALPDHWRTPEPAVLAWAEQLWEAGGRRVLDLSCGIGRHTVALARLGFTLTATDVSPSGLATCAAWLAREGLSATMVRHDMETFPFPERAFDGLIALYLRHAPGDKHLPHHYCDEPELRTFLAGFVVDDLYLVRREHTGGDGAIYVSAHYHVQARRL